MNYRHKRIVVDQLTVAVRQLETAIQLWFREEDPISIHTLVWAAREILRVQHKQAGKEPQIPLQKEASKTAQRKFDDRLSAAANFFKHYKGPKAVHDFAPELAAILMLDAVCLLMDINGGKLTGWLVLYMAFLVMSTPRRFTADFLEFARKNFPPDMLRQRNRAEFFSEFCQHLPKRRPLLSFTIDVLPDRGRAGS